MPLWTRPSPLEKLAKRQLLVLLGSEPALEAGEHVLDSDLEVDLVSTDWDGLNALPAFTSERALLAWKPEGGPWLALDGRVLFALVLDHGFDALIVDPGGDWTGIDRAVLAAVLGRRD